MVQRVSLHQLASFATLFWNHVQAIKVFAIHGEMGAGKTTTIAALCNHKGVQDVVSSPTFSIINEYLFFNSGESKRIYHIDLYRLKDVREAIQAGVEDCINSGEICMIEWPEKASELLNENALHITITAVDEITREIKFLPPTELNHHSIV
ncbi:MAG: tRNA (adenosine(37)-N6)-threonylcarbamoyltransferase complex ATPase subunit type 1 TsaE [Chitinophagaceae bacterium]